MSSGRGSIWKHNSKKKGFVRSLGSYDYRKEGDRFFVLTPASGGSKSRAYESPQAAMRDGWYIAEPGK